MNFSKLIWVFRITIRGTPGVNSVCGVTFDLLLLIDEVGPSQWCYRQRSLLQALNLSI